MRWDSLFSDFEGQWDAARTDEWRAEVAERTRGERAAIELSARLMGLRGRQVRVTLISGDHVAGTVSDCAHTWLLLAGEGARQHLIPAHSLAVVRGVDAIAQSLTEVDRKLGFTHALRALSRDRVRVTVRTVGAEIHGVIAAVHADHLDVVESSHGRASVPVGHILEVVSV